MQEIRKVLSIIGIVLAVAAYAQAVAVSLGLKCMEEWRVWVNHQKYFIVSQGQPSNTHCVVVVCLSNCCLVCFVGLCVHLGGYACHV